jgi:hypothetical protein
LTACSIAKSVTRLPKRRFYKCKSLREVDIAAYSALRFIGKEAFYGTGPFTILKPSRLAIINNGSFCEAAIKSMTFHDDSRLVRIGVGAYVILCGYRNALKWQWSWPCDLRVRAAVFDNCEIGAFLNSVLTEVKRFENFGRCEALR